VVKFEILSISYLFIHREYNKYRDPIGLEKLSHGTLKDLEYFQKNMNNPRTNQIVNYTWEKPLYESPSIHKSHPSEHENNKRNQNTLDLMVPYKGFPHCVKQNKWEGEPSDPPVFHIVPQKRKTMVLSSMTQ
jgi:hypothetical protein